MASSGKKKQPSSGSKSPTSKGQNSRTGGQATPRAPKPRDSTAADSTKGGRGSSGGGSSRRKAKVPESARPQPRARGGSSRATSSNGNSASGNGSSGNDPSGSIPSPRAGRSRGKGGARNATAAVEADDLDEYSDAEHDEYDEYDDDGADVIDDVEVLDDEGRPIGAPPSMRDRFTSMFSSLSAPASERDRDRRPARTTRKAEPEYRDDGTRVPTWGLGDVAIGFVLSLLAYTVSFLPLQALGYLPGVGGTGWPAGEVAGRVAVGQAPHVTLGLSDAPKPLLILLNYLPLWLGLMVPTAYAVWKKGNGFVKDLGLRFEWVDVPLGLGIGLACQLVLVPLIYLVVNKLLPGQDVSAVAQQVTDQAVDPLSTVMIFLVIGVGAPVVEEIYYRGLTQRAAERRFGPSWALIGTAAFFALMHGAPIVIPGLMIFALILGYLAQRFGRLGPSIFAHIGFNLVTAVVLIFHLNFAWIS